MFDATIAPGVEVREDNVTAYSATSPSTALPAFLFRPLSGDRATTSAVHFHSYADYRAAAGLALPADVSRCIDYWFSRGGGPCYAVPAGQIIATVSQQRDITLVVAAGIKSDIAQEVMTLYRRGSPVFFLLDGPEQAIDGGADARQVMANYPETANAAAWYPWAKTPDGAALLPPSAVAAAAIAQSDRQCGVWKSPANMTLAGIEPAFAVTDTLQARFSKGKALNMLRDLPGKGTTLWGARTLEDSDSWRYIAVRRLCSRVRSDVEALLRPLVFDVNGPLTWLRARNAIENYLHGLWQQGALMGSTPEQAWFVRIGKDLTMSSDEIHQGKMVVSIGLAASRPAEFITLKFTQSIH